VNSRLNDQVVLVARRKGQLRVTVKVRFCAPLSRSNLRCAFCHALSHYMPVKRGVKC